MNLQTFLNHPLINKAKIAYKLYPHLPELSAKNLFYSKLKGYVGKKSARKFSEEEEHAIREIWEGMKGEIDLDDEETELDLYLMSDYRYKTAEVIRDFITMKFPVIGEYDISVDKDKISIQLMSDKYSNDEVEKAINDFIKESKEYKFNP